jgi:hypothetical protein
MNMFTGVVVESFAYVYQRPGGVSVNREEISELSEPLSSPSLTVQRGFQEGVVVR